MSEHGHTILVVEDDLNLREALCDTLEFEGYAVETAADGEAALAVLRATAVDLVVSDVQMAPMDGHALLARLRREHASLPVVMMTAFGTIQQAVEAMRLGAADYIVKPFEATALVEKIARLLPAAVAVPGGDGQGPVAEDPASRRVLELARRVAASEATVMLTGESGTGKEVVARYIHACSPRSGGPFVAINCAAIPENMLEAVLFGYEKGAFTGAHRAHPGKFEQANGGTLLLDEITEMDLGLQAKLLRVLQEREVERVGGRSSIALDVRVLATSNRDLKEAVLAGRFREDLYYRLNVFPIELPPLRERPRDILPLARAILAREPGPGPVVLSPAAEARLQAYAWPGNVRELGNVLQRALILQSGGRIEAADLGLEEVAAGGGAAGDTAGSAAEVLDADLRAHEQQLILQALREVKGSRKEAARRLGISPRTLRYKLARMRDAGVELPA